MKNITRNWKLIGTLAVIILGLLMLEAAHAGSPMGPPVFPRDSVQFGRPYSEWAAEWWQWALSVPVSTHPLFDNGDCSVGQSGPVFFLGGKFCSNINPNCNPSVVTRTCSVPSGKALFFPIVNVEDSALEDPGKTLAELRLVTQNIIDGTADLSAEIDRVPIMDLKERFRVQSPAFGYTLPADNLFNAIGEGPFSAGTYFAAVDDGVYLMAPPLSRGSHTIHFHGAFPVFNFSLDVTYTLIVAP